jgi:hypothetical protein
MSKKTIPHKVWRRIVRATKTNDCQVGSVILFWFATTLGGLLSRTANVPTWYCILVGSIWVLVAFISNLINPLDEN